MRYELCFSLPIGRDVMPVVCYICRLHCRRNFDNHVRVCSKRAARHAVHATTYGGGKECEPLPNREESAGVVNEESEHDSSLSEEDRYSGTDSSDDDWDVRSVSHVGDIARKSVASPIWSIYANMRIQRQEQRLSIVTMRR